MQHPLDKDEHAINAINLFYQPCDSAPGIEEFIRGKKGTCFGIYAITDHAKRVILKKFGYIPLLIVCKHHKLWCFPEWRF